MDIVLIIGLLGVMNIISMLAYHKEVERHMADLERKDSEIIKLQGLLELNGISYYREAP